MQHPPFLYSQRMAPAAAVEHLMAPEDEVSKAVRQPPFNGLDAAAGRSPVYPER
jgi:hypothetical protein